MTLVQMMSSMQQIQSMIASMAQASPVVGDASSSNFDQVMSTMSPSATGDPGSVAPGSAGGSVTGADVVADAKKYLGVPYVLDGESTRGMDCSGLVQQTYKDLGITLPRTVHQQKLMGTAVPSLAQAQPGDLIVFKGGGHVAIYEGNDTVIHAPYPGRVVSNEKLWVGDSGIETIRRIVPTSTAAATTATAAAPAQTSSALQAAALAAVQATIQADSSLLLSSTGSSALGSSTGSSESSNPMQSAITQLESAAGIDPTTGTTAATDADSTTGTSTTGTASASATAAIEQFISTEEASLGEVQP